MFKVGDIVQLKSGGPKMTVEEIKGVGSYKDLEAVWFVNGKKESAGFKFVCLRKINARSK